MMNGETAPENANSMDDIAAGTPIVVVAPSHTPPAPDDDDDANGAQMVVVVGGTATQHQPDESPDSGKALIINSDTGTGTGGSGGGGIVVASTGTGGGGGIGGTDSTALKSASTTLEMQLQPTTLLASGAAIGTATTSTSTAMDGEQVQQMSSFEEHAKGKMGEEDSALPNFKVLYIVTQLLGLTMILLVGIWIGVHRGGLAGTDDPGKEFNWHPLFMTIGLIYLYGNSILIYRAFPTLRKKQLKIRHAAVHMAAFILAVIALKAVFDSHNLALNPIPNMYSLHSWLGLSAVIIFALQYVAGFVAYLSPGVREAYRAALMPLHIYFGVFGLVLAIASALTGLTEKAIFTMGSGYSQLPNEGVIVNIIGVLYVLFGCLVVYLVTEPAYKRKPIPEDTVLLTGPAE